VEPHADLLSAARYIMNQSSMQVELHHVRGHQDSTIHRPFTCDASLNIEVDLLAKGKLTLYMQGPRNFHIPWSQGTCYMNTQRVEKNFTTNIHNYINSQQISEYWRQCQNLTKGIWNTINWESIG